MYTKILNRIKEYDTIIIHRHSRPDGDALGSQLGLKDALVRTFPNKKIYAVGDMTPKYSFMGTMDEIDSVEYYNALAIVVDCPEKEMISDKRCLTAKYLIKIDHHIPKEHFGDIEYIKYDYESCCRVIAEVIFYLKFKLSSDGAKALFTGMVTDSGRFRYDSTTPATLRVASKLLAYNFNINDVYNNLYIDEYDMVLLRAKYLLKMQLTKNNVAYIITTYPELLETNADIFTISRGMVNTMSGIRGIDIWVNFTEDAEHKVQVEFRSSKYNVNEVATKYGGGGHIKASGTTLDSLDVIKDVLRDLDKIIEDNKNEGNN